jgi:hypothetical protein
MLRSRKIPSGLEVGGLREEQLPLIVLGYDVSSIASIFESVVTHPIHGA